MFFSISFKRLGLPLVAHCVWGSGQTETGGSPNLKLFICSSQEQVQKITTSDNLEGCEELSELVDHLPETSAHEMIEIGGDVGGSVGAMLVQMEKYGAIVQFFQPPELGGFWLPKATGPNGDVVFMYADESGKFHVVIAHNESQALRIIKGFDWMPDSRKRNLIQGVKNSNCSRGSGNEAQIIEGPVAELLYHASVWGKYQSAQRRSFN